MGQEVTDTGSGFIVGADPKLPPPAAADWQQSGASGSSTQVIPTAPPVAPQPMVQPPPPNNGQQYYTIEDIERVRREEKDKLYARIGQTETELQQLKTERETEAARLKAEADARAADLKKKEEAEMEIRDLLTRKEQEWNSRFEEQQKTYEQDRAVFAKERKLQEIESYKWARIEQEQEYIMPELRDLVHGATEAEIDASIEEMKHRTESIFQQIAQAQGQSRQQMRGAAPTAPPVGPMEQMPLQEQWTAEQISNMPMDEYKKNREALLRSAGQARRGF